MKEETEHGGVRGDNFGPKGGAVKLDKVFMGEEKIREKKSFAFTRTGGSMEVGKEMGVGRTGEPLTDGEKGGVNGKRTRATTKAEIGRRKRKGQEGKKGWRSVCDRWALGNEGSSNGCSVKKID